MAEFCKKCFIESLLTLREKCEYIDGKLKIIETEESCLCEGCGNTTNVVDYVLHLDDSRSNNK